MPRLLPLVTKLLAGRRASCGGGKSGFRRDDFLLHGRLVGEPQKLLSRIADLLLRVGD
jgi:hypothetical protein